MKKSILLVSFLCLVFSSFSQGEYIDSCPSDYDHILCEPWVFSKINDCCVCEYSGNTMEYEFGYYYSSSYNDIFYFEKKYCFGNEGIDPTQIDFYTCNGILVESYFPETGGPFGGDEYLLNEYFSEFGFGMNINIPFSSLIEMYSNGQSLPNCSNININPLRDFCLLDPNYFSPTVVLDDICGIDGNTYINYDVMTFCYGITEASDPAICENCDFSNTIFGSNNITTTSATLIALDAPANSTFTWYYKKVTDSDYMSTDTGSPILTLTGLTPNTTYQWYVIVFCGNQPNLFSPEMQFTTANISCDNVGNYSSSPTSNSATLGVSQISSGSNFEWEYRESNTSPWSSISTSTTSTTINGLQPSTEYEWRVTVTCPNQNSQTSPIQTFVTLPINGENDFANCEDYFDDILCDPLVSDSLEANIDQNLSQADNWVFGIAFYEDEFYYYLDYTVIFAPIVIDIVVYYDCEWIGVGVCVEGSPEVADGCYESIDPDIPLSFDPALFQHIEITNDQIFSPCPNQSPYNVCDPCIPSGTCIDLGLIDPAMACTDNYDPVCGCDGKTYPNACVAKYQYGITITTEGECGYFSCIDSSMINENAICPAVFDPVCGCDGVTYPNACNADANGVISYIAGECAMDCIDENLIDLDLNCIATYDPVCGCDGTTYINDCFAFASGITNYTDGTCSNIDCDSIIYVPLPILPDINPQDSCEQYGIDEVCGCDGITYENSCFAFYAEVNYYIPGACEDQDDCYITDPEVLAELVNLQCPANIDPVCGCDDNEYNNACNAFKAGIKKWTNGPCPDTQCPLPTNYFTNFPGFIYVQFVVPEVDQAVSYSWEVREVLPSFGNWIPLGETIIGIYDWFNFEDCKSYEWRVKVNCANGMSPWSLPQPFDVDFDCTAMCELPPLSTFNTIETLDNSIQLSIQAVSDALQYQWQIREVAPNLQSWDQAIVDESTLINIFDWFGFDDCKSYEWRVRIICNGLTSEWSQEIPFEIDNNCNQICTSELRYIKINYKGVLSQVTGLPPTVYGQTVDVQYLQSMVDWMNSIMVLNETSFRFCFSLDYIGGIDDPISNEYYNAVIDGDTRTNIEADAIAEEPNGNPYLWSNEAINIYMLQGSGTDQDYGGVCSFPDDHEVIIIGGRNSGADTHLHEIGHFFNLYHTHGCICSTSCTEPTDTDEVDDTVADMTCWTKDELAIYHFGVTYALLQGSEQKLIENTYNNIMSYHDDRYVLTNGQMERWCQSIIDFESREDVVHDSPCVDDVCIDESLIDEDTICPADYTPVCGCNGITYPNACNAEKAGVTFFTPGACYTDCIIEVDTIYYCPFVYDPVCGCDGVTYSNSCSASLAGVINWTPGACQLDPCDNIYYPLPIIDCSEIYEPVCGCDQITYDNACEAQSVGIYEYVPGACCIDISLIGDPSDCPAIYDPVCDCFGNQYANACIAIESGVEFPISCDFVDCIDEAKINSEIVCPLLYDPICGCDGVTYGNECEAFKNGVISWTSGPCATDCIDESLIDDNIYCTLEYQPICGCDGVTYSNVCNAIKKGLTSWIEGPCQNQDCIDVSLIDDNVPCPAVIAPVCGCDGATYDNDCEARTIGGVTSWTNGPCLTPIPCEVEDQDNIFIDVFCPQNISPVCGCNDMTYINECLALKDGIIDWVPGPCGDDVIGCTDPDAYNYNSAANVDDGTCQTCYDGIMNGDEEGIDCGGSKCPNSCESLSDLTFYFEDQSFIPNSTQLIPVKVLNFENVSSFQFQIGADNNQVQLLGIKDALMQVSSNNVSPNLLNVTGFSTNIDGVSVADGTILFYVEINTVNIDCFNMYFSGGNNNEFEILAVFSTDISNPVVPTTIGAEYCKSVVYDVNGIVEREDELRLEGVDILVNFINATNTNMNGMYALPNLSTATNTTIEPTHDTKAQEGVNVVDVADINRFILGIEGFDSKYKEIAADIDGNKKVNIVDLTLAIGAAFDRFESYPTNNTWKFVPQDYQFVRTSNFFKEQYPEEVINGVSSINTEPDFYAIKLGDVNYSYEANKLIPFPLAFEINNDNQWIDIILDQENALGFQFSLVHPNIESIEIESDQSNISVSQEMTSDGQHSILVFSSDGNSFDINLLSMYIIPKGPIDDINQGDIELGSHMSPILYTENQTFTLTLEGVLSTFQNEENSDILIYPNPFSSKITIEIEDNKSALLNIYHPQGNIIYSSQMSSKTFITEEILTRSGMYFFEFVIEGQKTIKKVIRI